MSLATQTPLTQYIETIAQSGLILDADQDTVQETVEACCDGQRLSWMATDDNDTRPLARVTCTLKLWYAGEVRKVRTYEWEPRATETPEQFGHRVLAVVAEIVQQYVGRQNLVTLRMDSYTQDELNALDALYAGSL